MDFITSLTLFFVGITILCFILFLLIPDKKYLEISGKGGSTVYRINGFGTCMYGRKILDEEQLQYYGFEQFEHEGKMYWPPAIFKTIFITALWIPLIPIKTQIIIDRNENWHDDSFYAIPVKMYWKQAFAILSFSYLILSIPTIMTIYGGIGMIYLLIIFVCILFFWVVFSIKSNK